MPKPKYDHPVIQKGAVQVFAHLAQKPLSADLRKVKNEIGKMAKKSGHTATIRVSVAL